MQGLQAATELITEFMSSKGYGEIVLKIEAGKIVVVKKTETIKLTD